MNINAIQAVKPLDIQTPLTALQGNGNAAFSDVLHAAYTRAENSGAQAAQMLESFISGDRDDLHTVAMAGQKAGLEFDMMLQVRNKLVQAYQEVMRMQL